MPTGLSFRPEPGIDPTYIHLDHGHGVAAEVLDTGTRVEIRFHVDGGHTEPTARADLVAAVLDLPLVRRHHVLQLAVPLGEADLLEELRRRCASFSARAAGATCLIDALLPAPYGNPEHPATGN